MEQERECEMGKRGNGIMAKAQKVQEEDNMPMLTPRQQLTIEVLFIQDSETVAVLLL